MNSNQFNLDGQLKKDTHFLFSTGDFYILLHKNASIPWLILVPLTDVIEVYDLSVKMQLKQNDMTKIIADYFNKKFNSEKMNIAAIGNIVKQLHIHVIGRSSSDACWPDVIWGRDLPSSVYTLKQVEEISKDLIRLIKKP